MDGWAVRFANGYSGRANSASAVRIGADLDAALMAEVTNFFRERGLAPAIRVTPLAEAGLEARLVGNGWTVASRSMGMITEGLAGAKAAPGLVVECAPSRAWIEGVSTFQEARKRNPDHLEAIVSRIRRPARFATLMVEGQAAAYGMTVVDRGMSEIGLIMVVPGMRGLGLGQVLVAGLMQAAGEAGARRCFLQVEAENRVARRLYTALGFRDLYPYCEVRLPNAP